MRLFIYEYGRILLGVLLAAVLVGAVFSGFVQKWREFGGVDDTVKTDFQNDEEKRTPPVLTASDFKILAGDELRIGDHVSANDYDGRDLSHLVRREVVKEKPGILRVALRVTSPVTGKTVRGSLIVLVDCAGEGGEEINADDY